MEKILTRYYYPIKNHTVKVYLNILLDTGMKVKLFHHCYA